MYVVPLWIPFYFFASERFELSLIVRAYVYVSADNGTRKIQVKNVCHMLFEQVGLHTEPFTAKFCASEVFFLFCLDRLIHPSNTSNGRSICAGDVFDVFGLLFMNVIIHT